MEWDRLRISRLKQRIYRVWQVLPDNALFAVGEEAARELAEANVRMMSGDEMENVAHEMSKMLVDALRSNSIMELWRAAIRLFTMQTTLYLDVNFCIREHDVKGEGLMRDLEKEMGVAHAGMADDDGLDRLETACGGWFARNGRTGMEDSESFGFYAILLEQALLRWPQRLGEVDVYRGVTLSDDEIDTYRDRVGRGVEWAGFASTSLSRRIAERFGTVLFVIHTRDRPYIGEIAEIRREQEVLFARGTCAFVVEGVTTDRRTGRTVIELRDFQCHPDSDATLTPEEAREWVAHGLDLEFGEKEALVVLEGPVGQERIADALEPRSILDGIGFAHLVRFGGDAWRKDRARIEAEMRAARAEAERRARANAGFLVRAARTSLGLTARLIALGADLEVTDCDGMTPLMIAVCNRNWRMARLLLDAGANA
jgi:hypothetical protein